METYFDSDISYRADAAYRREQLVAGLGASRRAARARRTFRSIVDPGRGGDRSRDSARGAGRRLTRADVARRA